MKHLFKNFFSHPPSKKAYLFGLVVPFVVVLLDWLTKQIALEQLEYGRLQDVLPQFFGWLLVFNKGAAFGFLSQYSGWQMLFLSLVSGIASIGILLWIYKLCNKEPELVLFPTSLSLILSGAIGNFIDRAFYGFVIDFVSVHYQKTYFFPSFNIADACISIGAVLYLFWNFIGYKGTSINS